METILNLIKKILDMGWEIDISNDIPGTILLHFRKNRYHYLHRVYFNDFMMLKDIESAIKEIINFLIFKLEEEEKRLKAKESELNDIFTNS